MIFVINKLKYDTDHMRLVSDKCEYAYTIKAYDVKRQCYGRNVKLWKSEKGNWLLTYEDSSYCDCGIALSSEEAERYLLKYDLGSYEKEFGPLEEA